MPVTGRAQVLECRLILFSGNGPWAAWHWHYIIFGNFEFSSARRTHKQQQTLQTARGPARALFNARLAALLIMRQVVIRKLATL